MKHISLLRRLLFAALAFFLLSATAPSAVRAQNRWCQTRELSWAYGSTSTKQFTISSRDSASFSVNSSACSHYYVYADYGNYTVSVTPTAANSSQTDIVQNLSVTIYADGTPVLETVTLRHLAAPAPEPEPDYWDAVSADLPDTLSWILRTTVTSADSSSWTRDVTFYDGLGYPEQEVLVGASPGGAKSIYTPIVYDRMRRADATTYLPYAATTPAGVFDASALTRQPAFYGAAPYSDSRPFAEKTYESSPAGRVLSAQREGVKWNEGGGHRTQFSYRANTVADAIPRYTILPGSSKAAFGGVWPEGTLHCTESEDEEGSVSRVFTDPSGRVILSEVQAGVTDRARTLFIYDIRDSLAVVVQPEGMAALEALEASAPRDISMDTSGVNSGIAASFCFIRKYDGRGNLLSEHTPGGGTVRYTYDERNRVICKTDSRMEAASGKKELHTHYDYFDRVVGEWYLFSATDSLRTLSREYFPFTHESSDYPSSGDGAFVPEAGVAETPDLETECVKGLLRKETVHPTPSIGGTVRPGEQSVTRYYHYDSKGRVIQVNERRSDGRLRRVSTKYSFTGDVLATKETVIVPAGNNTPAAVHSLVTTYTRDPRGRVLGCSRVLDGTETLETVSYTYDDLGRLTGKNVGSAGSPALRTALACDLHGWTTGISVAMKEGPGNSLDTVFSETLRYADQGKDAGARRFDGNISETSFSHRVVSASGSPYLQTNTWSYAYDGMKRLTDAGHYVGASSTPSLTDTERGITYDRNGNITHLKRYGSTGLENDLEFTHTGNRMTSLSDANATGSASGSKSFTYDENGNLTHDGRKGLEMRWNVLNLLDSAGVHGSSLKYSWLSDGTKVSASEDDGKGNVIKRHYVGSFVFVEVPVSGEWLKESVCWDEGRIFFDVPFIVDSTVVDDPLVEDRGYRDCWYARDHLGNVRAVIDITPDLPAPRVLEQSDYLPFGTKILNPSHASMQANRWRYAGKEEQAFGSLNLGLLDFGARMYDPFTARWTAADPLAGKYLSYSPASYCANNPINIYDLFGTEWDDDGKTITLFVNLTKNEALSSQQIESYTSAIQELFNEVIYNASGGELQGKIVFSNSDPHIIQELHLGVFADPNIGGTTTYTFSDINVSGNNGEYLPPEIVAQTAVHELFHTVRLGHPFEITQTNDTKLIKIGNNAFNTTASTDPNIANNIMNYSFITINGNKGSDLRYLTSQQLNFIRKEIKLQKRGYGYSTHPSDYEEKYFRYWQNIPGTPVSSQ